VGSVCVSLSPSIAVLLGALTVYALGAGYSGASRSVVTSFATKEETGRLYAVVSILDMVGTLVAGPSLSKLFTWGLEKGDIWTGVPFWFAGVLFALVGVLLWSVKIGKMDEACGEDEGSST
jgi:MFS family permease